jgi:RNA polymerase sigma-70 factor (ECF subfamily)
VPLAETTTDKLTAAMSAGDEDAVELFYRRYFDWLYAQARRCSRRDESFCLDVVQDAVLRIIRTIRPVRSEMQFRAWLRLVVQTTVLDRLRTERRRTNREIAVLAATSAVEAIDESAEGDDESQRAWLRAQVAQFDPQLVQMIELRYRKDWTLVRIAALLGLSIGTVDGRLRRAIKTLRDRAIEAFDDVD